MDLTRLWSISFFGIFENLDIFASSNLNTGFLFFYGFRFKNILDNLFSFTIKLFLSRYISTQSWLILIALDLLLLLNFFNGFGLLNWGFCIICSRFNNPSILFFGMGRLDWGGHIVVIDLFLILLYLLAGISLVLAHLYLLLDLVNKRFSLYIDI